MDKGIFKLNISKETNDDVSLKLLSLNNTYILIRSEVKYCYMTCLEFSTKLSPQFSNLMYMSFTLNIPAQMSSDGVSFRKFSQMNVPRLKGLYFEEVHLEITRMKILI